MDFQQNSTNTFLSKSKGSIYRIFHHRNAKTCPEDTLKKAKLNKQVLDAAREQKLTSDSDEIQQGNPASDSSSTTSDHVEFVENLQIEEDTLKKAKQNQQVLDAVEKTTTGEHKLTSVAGNPAPGLCSTTSDHAEFQANPQKEFQIYYQNVHGIRTKKETVYENSQIFPHEVFVLCETWLNKEIEDSTLFNENFKVFRQDRHKHDNAKVGGGLIIAVKKPLKSEKVSECSNSELQMLCAKIAIPLGYLYVVVVYIPISSKPGIYANLYNNLEDICDQINELDKIIVMGDFNLKNLEWTKFPESCAFMPTNVSKVHEVCIADGMANFGLRQVNGVKNQNGNWLDLVYFSEDVNSDCNVMLSELSLVNVESFHPPLSISLSLNACCGVFNQMKFNYKKCDENKLSNLLKNVNWDNAFMNLDLDLDEMIVRFYEELLDCFKKTTPLCKVRMPCLDPKLQTLKIRRKIAWENIKKNRKMYEKLKNEFQNLCSDSIAENKNKIKSDPEQFWNYVEDNKKCDSYPERMEYKKSSSSLPNKISNMFAEHFKSIYTSTGSISYNCIPKQYNELNLESFEISEASILDAISKVETSLYPGPDGVPSYILKKFASHLSYPLYLIFNKSLKCSQFPGLWKRAFIEPIHNKGPETLITSYRPSAKLSTISNLFESLVFETVYSKCSATAIVCENQHGFSKKKSTITNLLEFNTFCLDAFEKNLQVDCMFTNLREEFDNINHEILLQKLTKIGLNVNLVKWIESYLKDRYFRVVFKNYSSSRFKVNNYGIPKALEGCCNDLHGILFLLFISDLPSVLKDSNNSNILMYEYDVKIFREVKSSADCDLLQDDLKKFSEWCRANGLNLNISKCKTMSLTRKKEPLNYDYKLNSCRLERKSSYFDLYIWLDQKLTFSPHVNYIIKKASMNLIIIQKFCRQFKNSNYYRLLYFSLVKPEIEYGFIVWAPYKKKDIEKIESIQQRFENFFQNIFEKVSDTQSYLVQLKYLQFCFIFGILNGSILSQSLLERLNLNNRRPGLRSSDTLQLSPVFSRFEYGKNSPLNQLIAIYNKNYSLISDNDNIRSVEFRNKFYEQNK